PSDLESICKSMIGSEVTDATLKASLEKHCEQLLAPFERSGVANARVVRKVIWAIAKLTRGYVHSLSPVDVSQLYLLASALMLDLDRDRTTEGKLRYLLTPGNVSRPRSLPALGQDATQLAANQRQEYDAYYDLFANRYYEGSLASIPRVAALLDAMYGLESSWEVVVQQYLEWSSYRWPDAVNQPASPANRKASSSA
ncbi:MAG: hypothetical protein ABUU24_03650, partial [Variovorax sp.]